MLLYGPFVYLFSLLYCICLVNKLNVGDCSRAFFFTSDLFSLPKSIYKLIYLTHMVHHILNSKI